MATTKATPAAPVQAKADGKGGRKAMPDYDLQKLTDLPEDLAPEAGGGRKYLYFNLLKNGPMQEPGEWFRIAYFYTADGAKVVAKDLTPDKTGETKRPIPDGVWEISGRTVADPDNPSGPKHSALFARYLGEE